MPCLDVRHVGLMLGVAMFLVVYLDNRKEAESINLQSEKKHIVTRVYPVFREYLPRYSFNESQPRSRLIFL